MSASRTYDRNPGSPTAVGALGNYLFDLNGWIIDISATLEPDADNDGFGDESQDQCLGQAGGSNGCPGPLPAAPSSQPVTKKKCKKHKHRSASAAKKHCKKKSKKGLASASRAPQRQEGKVVRMETDLDPDEALEAAGLLE